MEIRIVDTDSAFDALEEPWNRLSDQTASNFFSSFDYVRTAWKHFRSPDDRLYILVLSEGESVVGIAPFYTGVGRDETWGIPHRAIRWIAMWGGDRPRLLVGENEEMFWVEILHFLKREKHSWDVIDLVEQPVDGPEGRGWSFLSRFGWYWEESPDSTDYYISLEGSWEEYLKGRSSNTRRGWDRRRRRLSSTPGGYQIERVSDPEGVREALSRFVAIERESWKAKARIGAGKNERSLLFYEELLLRVAGKGRAFVYFLKSGGKTIAGEICFIQQDVICSLLTTYLPSYAAYSPGILILADITQSLFGGPYRELDLLGMRDNGTQAIHKAGWATGKRETVHLTAYRMDSRLLPLVVAKRLKRMLRRTREEVKPNCESARFES
jgi:CelD/BcsL family acetyltransferase involved in cellulose biosynthesis